MVFIVSDEKCTMQKTSDISRVTHGKRGKIENYNLIILEADSFTLS